MKIKPTDVLWNETETIKARLTAGEMTVEQARVESSLVKHRINLIQSRIEVAKLTGRFVQGSSDLPAFTMEIEPASSGVHVVSGSVKRNGHKAKAAA